MLASNWTHHPLNDPKKEQNIINRKRDHTKLVSTK